MLENNPYIIEKLNTIRNAEMRKQAQVERLIADSKLKNSGYPSRFLARSGEFLIQIGQRLQMRYAYKAQDETKLPPTGSRVPSNPC